MRAIVAVHEALLLDGSVGDELVAAAVDLLNSEWGRSEAAREVSVRNCKEGFPVNLALVEGPWPAQGWRAVAFVRLSRCDDKENAVLAESLVVDKERRGQGLGRETMAAAEAFAQRSGFSCVCLSTHDQQPFYEHIGYERSEPVTSLGSTSKFLDKEQLSGLMGIFAKRAAAAAPAVKEEPAQTWYKKDLPP